MVGSSPTPAPPAASTSFGTLQLRLTSGPQQGRIVELAARKCSIGSAARCTLRLRAAGIQPIHALVDRSGEITQVRRHAGEALLNDQAFEQAPLRVGDRLRLGPLEFEVVVDEKPLEQSPTNYETAHQEAASDTSSAATQPDQAKTAATATVTYTEQFRQLDARFEDLEQRLTELGRSLTATPRTTEAAGGSEPHAAEISHQAIGQIASQLNEQLAAQANEFADRLSADSAARIDELAARLQEELAQATPHVAEQAAAAAAQRLSQQLPDEIRQQVSTEVQVAAERLGGELGQELSAGIGELGEQLGSQLIKHVDAAITQRVPQEVAQHWEIVAHEKFETATAAALSRVSDDLAARLEPEIQGRIEAEAVQLRQDLEANLSQRLSLEITRQVAEVTDRIGNGSLSEETANGVRAEVTPELLAEIGSRIEPELASRLKEQMTGQMVELLSPRIDAGLASWEAERAGWLERQQEMQSQLAAHTELLDSRLQNIAELQRAVEVQSEQLRLQPNNDEPGHAARLVEIERALDELRSQQASWIEQRDQWREELRQVRDELSERAEKTRTQVSRLEARWETFEDEQRHRQRDHEHSTTEQIDQRLAGIRAEREAFENERHHDRPHVHPGEHVRQIDERLAEIQARRVPQRERQSTWQDKLHEPDGVGEAPGQQPHSPQTTDSGPASAQSLQGVETAAQSDAVVDNALLDARGEVRDEPHHEPAAEATAPTLDPEPSTVPDAAEQSEAAEEVHFQPVSEQSPASVLERFARLQSQDAEDEALAQRRQPAEPEHLPASGAPAANETSSDGNDDEESIEAYMARLMQRVRTISEEPAKPATHATPTRLSAPKSESATPAAVAKPATTPAPVEQQPIVDLSELAPRSLPAESTSNISAMRDLANISARMAIDVHQRKRMTSVIYSKLAVAVAALAASVALAWMSSTNRPVSYAAALVAMVVGVVWGLEYLMLTGSRLFTTDKRPDNKPS